MTKAKKTIEINLSDQAYTGIEGGYKGPGKFADVNLISAKLTGDNKLTVKFTEQTKTGQREHVLKCGHIAHDELVESFDQMLFDLLNLCEQPEAVMGSADSFNLPEGGVVHSINFNDMVLSGEKLSEKSEGATLSLTTPRVFDGYERYEELVELLNAANLEVKLYLNGKQRYEQPELFNHESNNDIEE
jgi:hypothetical protein